MAEVITIQFIGDNSLALVWHDGTIVSYAAEWCQVVTKIEDRDDFFPDKLDQSICKAFDKFIIEYIRGYPGNFKRNNEERLKEIVMQYEERKLTVDDMIYYLCDSGIRVFEARDYQHD